MSVFASLCLALGVLTLITACFFPVYGVSTVATSSGGTVKSAFIGIDLWTLETYRCSANDIHVEKAFCEKVSGKPAFSVGGLNEGETVCSFYKRNLTIAAVALCLAILAGLVSFFANATCLSTQSERTTGRKKVAIGSGVVAVISLVTMLAFVGATFNAECGTGEENKLHSSATVITKSGYTTVTTHVEGVLGVMFWLSLASGGLYLLALLATVMCSSSSSSDNTHPNDSDDVGEELQGLSTRNDEDDFSSH